MATLPTRKVEIEFDAGVWTDVAADVVSLSTARGRNRESGAFEAGTITVDLRNDTRKYDPDHTAGTYYGKLRPNRRIRFRATYSAVTYDIFVGYIDRITQNYGGPNDATATIEATDFFKLLALAQLPASVYRAEVFDDTPASVWPFDEPVGSTTAADIVGTRNLSYLDGPTLGGTGLVVRDPGASAFFTAASLNRAQYPSGNLITGFPFTIEAWIKVTGASAVVGQQIYSETYGTSGMLRLEFGTGAPGPVSALWFVLESGGVTNALVYNTVSLSDNAVHHVVVTATASNAVKLYIDGVDATNISVTTANAFPAGTGKAAWGNWPDGLSGRGLGGYLQYGAIYAAALSAGRAAAHNTAGRTPWDDDSPGTRLARIFDLVTVSGSYELDAGTTTLQSTDLEGDALSYAQKVEETEAGRLFVKVDGTVRFLGRQEAETGDYLTSQATLVDDDSGAGIPYRSVSADVDGSTIVTRATVSREGSVAITYYDATAQAEFGWLDEVHEGLLHDSDTYSRYYAQWIVNTHKTPTSRVGTLTMDLPKDPAAMYPAILSLELAERVTYKRKPQNTGSVITIPMRVEKIEHATGPHYWRTSLQLSPFNLGAGGYGTGVWDTSLWDQATWGL